MEVVVGRVAKVHGLGGELAVDVHTDSPDQRFEPGAKVIAKLRGSERRELSVASAREHASRLLVSFSGVADRNAAEELRGALLLADTADLAPISDPDEFYDHELEGLAAEFSDGAPAGTVTEVLHSPGGELLSVQTGDATVLVPFVRAIVTDVDLLAGKVVLDPPEGLF